MTVIIKLKDKEIIFNDIVDLTEEQFQFILSVAKYKTEKQWLNPETKGVKIRLSKDQLMSVLSYKNQMVRGHTSNTLMGNRMVRFTNHGLKRIALRIDRDAFPKERTIMGMVDVVIHSQDVDNEAEWRGYRNLSYNLNGMYDGKACKMSVVFDGSIIVITVITDETTPTTYSMDTLLTSNVMTKLQDMRNSLKK